MKTALPQEIQDQIDRKVKELNRLKSLEQHSKTRPAPVVSDAEAAKNPSQRAARGRSQRYQSHLDRVKAGFLHNPVCSPCNDGVEKLEKVAHPDRPGLAQAALKMAANEFLRGSPSDD